MVERGDFFFHWQRYFIIVQLRCIGGQWHSPSIVLIYSIPGQMRCVSLWTLSLRVKPQLPLQFDCQIQAAFHRKWHVPCPIMAPPAANQGPISLKCCPGNPMWLKRSPCLHCACVWLCLLCASSTRDHGWFVFFALSPFFFPSFHGFSFSLTSTSSLLFVISSSSLSITYQVASWLSSTARHSSKLVAVERRDATSRARSQACTTMACRCSNWRPRATPMSRPRVTCVWWVMCPRCSPLTPPPPPHWLICPPQ